MFADRFVGRHVLEKTTDRDRKALSFRHHAFRTAEGLSCSSRVWHESRPRPFRIRTRQAWTCNQGEGACTSDGFTAAEARAITASRISLDGAKKRNSRFDVVRLVVVLVDLADLSVSGLQFLERCLWT